MGEAEMTLEYGYAGHIVKADKQPDGSLMVYGMATDPSLDLDGQGCDPEWLKRAMPDWFKVGNIREQHGPVAAGVGKELERTDNDQWMLKAHIVDANTVRKVNAGVLKGFSIGVRNGKVQRDKAAGYPNGKIVDGNIVEISLVDRPCNPKATMTIVKAAPGGDVLEPVREPVLVDVDPSMYDQGVNDGDGAGEHDDADVLVIGEDDDTQGVDDGVDDGELLSLFDEIAAGMEPPYAFGEDDDLDDVLAAAESTDEPVLITKGLLEQLVHGSGKKDGDGDGKTGEGDERGKDAERRRRLKEAQEREREQARRHRNRMDAERAQDANRAQRAGRRMEAGEHRGRLGHYDKTLSVLEYRSGMRLVDAVLSGHITKGAGLLDSDDDEIVAELAELVVAEAGALAAGSYAGDPEDVSLLLDACAAIAKMAGAEPTNRRRDGYVLDDSEAGATLDDAEIVKAQVAELSKAREAQEAELAELRAQVARMAATPIPGGPVVNKSVMPSIPAQSVHAARAADLERQAANPLLAADVAAGYRALAELERAKG